MADLRQTVWGAAQAVEFLPPEDQDPNHPRLDSIDNAMVIAALPDIRDLDLARAHTLQVSKSAGILKTWEHQLVQRQLESEGARGIRLGNTWYRIEQPARWKVVDMKGLCDWIESNCESFGEPIYHAINTIWPESAARVTGLRALAERWGWKNPAAVVGTFMEKQPYRDEETVSATPLHKAPKFAQALDDGERWGPSSRKEDQ